MTKLDDQEFCFFKISVDEEIVVFASKYKNVKGKPHFLIEVWANQGNGNLKKTREISLPISEDADDEETISGIEISENFTGDYFIAVLEKFSGRLTVIRFNRENCLYILHEAKLRIGGLETFGLEYFEQSFWVLGDGGALIKLNLEIDSFMD